jgi:O-antigen/teichoic acid export membrane protein
MAAGDPDPLVVEAPAAARASLPRAFLVVAPAMAAANALNYAFNLVMSRALGPADYGALGALLALVLVGTVPGVALQAVVARHTTLAGEAVGRLWSRVLVAVVAVGGALALATVAASPALRAFLHLPSLGPCLWLAAALLPLPLLSAVQGMLQGREWFGALAAVLLVAAAGRLAAGVGLVEGGLGVEGALAGTAAGSAVAVLVAVPRLRARGRRERRDRTPGPRAGWRRAPGSRVGWGRGWRRAPGCRVGWGWWRREAPGGGFGGEVAAAAAGVLGLLLLANVDVLLARHFLPAEASGLYAAGSVLAKIAYWAPQFVVTLVFPRLVVAADRRRLLWRSAAVVAAVGAPLVAGAALAPQLATRLSFGEAYLDVGSTLPLFAALGTGHALVQLILFTGMAGADKGAYRLLLAAVATEATLVALFLHDSVAEIVGASLAVVAALLAMGFGLAARPPARELPG